MDSDRQRILSKIAQMSKLVESSGAFKGEASNAALKIQELMEKYSVSWAEVYQLEASRQSAEYEKVFDRKRSEFTIGLVKKWHWDLARIIAKITHTKYFMRGSYMFFFGVDANAQIASSLYAEWVVTVDAAAKHALKKYRSWLVSKFYTGQKNFYTTLPRQYQTKDYRESWIVGCLEGIMESVEREAEQSNALVLYDEEVAKKFHERHKINQVQTREMNLSSSDGYTSGREYGRNVNLHAKKLEK